jgi:glutathione S-transferase
VILYDSPSPAPNPRRVRIFAAEKGIALDLQPVSLIAREHKSAQHLARNPLGQTPVLVLDDGTAISETLAICRYLEALYPEPSLFGQSPIEIATIEMWIRRTEFALGGPVRNYWVNVHPFTAKVVPQRFEDFGNANVPHAMAAMAVFDAALAESPFIAGADYTMADIVLLATVDFSDFIGLAIPDTLTNLKRWHGEVSARPSASA